MGDIGLSQRQDGHMAADGNQKVSNGRLVSPAASHPATKLCASSFCCVMRKGDRKHGQNELVFTRRVTEDDGQGALTSHRKCRRLQRLRLGVARLVQVGRAGDGWHVGCVLLSPSPPN